MAKSFSRKIQVGDRCLNFAGHKGTITAIKKGLLKYEIRWDNGKSEAYTQKEFSKWCEALPPEPKAEDIEGEGLSLLDLVSASPEIHTEESRNTNFPREQDWKVSDRILLKHTNLTGLILNLDTGTIAWDSGETTSNNTISKTYYKKCSPNSTCAVASAQDSPLLGYSSANLNSLDSAKSTATVEKSFSLDTPMCQSPETSKAQTKPNSVGGSVQKRKKRESKSLQLALPVLPSPCRENAGEPTMRETASQQLSERSQASSHSFSVLKMCADYYLAHTEKVWGKEAISGILCGSYPSAGTMSNGRLSAADILALPSLEKGCSWLESPGALSSGNSRAPGQSKLEAQLKKSEVLEPGECINPIFLEDAFTIPLGWSDRLVSQSATALLEEKEKRSATVLTPELPALPSVESSTSIHSWKVGDRCKVPHFHGADNVPGTIIKWDKDLGWGVQVDEWWKYCQVKEPEKKGKPLGNGWWKSEQLKPEVEPDQERLLNHSLEKFDFYVTVPAGVERSELMPNDLCYLFVASSFWNRSRAKIRSFPRCPQFPAGARTAADAGGYIAAKDWGGKYPYTPAQYVKWLLNWCNDWAATMDYPCEPPLTGGNRGKIRHRQKQTTKLAWHFWNTYRDVHWQWVPTVQGWDTKDYIHHAQELKPLIQEMKQHYGVVRVGIGTLCSRTSNAQIEEIVKAVSGILPDVQFHLWGVKQDAAPIVKSLPQVVSSDSAAWDGLAGSRCRKVWEEEYKGRISQAEYSWTIALPKYIKSLEKKLGCSVRGDRPNSLEKPETQTSKQTGSLYQYTANKADKQGNIHTYPKVEGDRRREEDSHWYWGFSYVEKEQGKWRDKSASIPRKKVSAVRQALRDGKPYTYILQEILKK